MLKAAIYDFDGTLTPDDLPEFKILEKCGLENGVHNPQFMPMVESKMRDENIDVVRAMILVVLDTMKSAGIPSTDENICYGAEQRKFNPGVLEFLEKLQKAGVKNYVLTSGVKAYIERTAMTPYCTEIFGSTLNYNEAGEATGLDLVMTFDEKATTLRRLAEELNGSAENCEGMVYVGDGPTDAPAMEFVKAHGGNTILVCYDLGSEVVKEMREKGIVDLFTPADYHESSELAEYVDKLMTD